MGALNLDDLHPIVREMFEQELDQTRAMGTSPEASERDALPAIFQSLGIVDPAKRRALIETINATCRAITDGEERTMRDPQNVFNQVFLALTLGIRLARKGLV